MTSNKRMKDQTAASSQRNDLSDAANSQRSNLDNQEAGAIGGFASVTVMDGCPQFHVRIRGLHSHVERAAQHGMGDTEATMEGRFHFGPLCPPRPSSTEAPSPARSPRALPAAAGILQPAERLAPVQVQQLVVSLPPKADLLAHPFASVSRHSTCRRRSSTLSTSRTPRRDTRSRPPRAVVGENGINNGTGEKMSAGRIRGQNAPESAGAESA